LTHLKYSSSIFFYFIFYFRVTISLRNISFAIFICDFFPSTGILFLLESSYAYAFLFCGLGDLKRKNNNIYLSSCKLNYDICLVYNMNRDLLKCNDDIMWLMINVITVITVYTFFWSTKDLSTFFAQIVQSL